MNSLPAFEGLRASQLTPTQATVACRTVHARPFQVVCQKRVVKRKQVILLDNVPNLGKAGQLLSVKMGYFRNFLYPFGKAKTASEEILQEIRAEQEKKEAEKRRVLEEAQAVAIQFKTIGGFNVRRKAGQGKSIFGSVTTQDLVDIIKANTGREVDKKDVTMPEIREVGQFEADIKLHPEVIARVRINVIGK